MSLIFGFLPRSAIRRGDSIGWSYPRPMFDHFSPVLEPVAGKVLAVAENAIHFTFRWPEIKINLFSFFCWCWGRLRLYSLSTRMALTVINGNVIVFFVCSWLILILQAKSDNVTIKSFFHIILNLASHEDKEETAVLTPGRSYVSGSKNLLSLAPTRTMLRWCF